MPRFPFLPEIAGFYKKGYRMNRLTRTFALAGMLGVALGSAVYAVPAAARTVVVVDAGMAPPPPHYERIPEGRPGYVWAPGYWRWDAYAHRHVWVGGYWMRGRPGYHWVPGVWVQRGPNWHWRDGYWGR
jgi:hypothetical protein